MSNVGFYTGFFALAAHGKKAIVNLNFLEPWRKFFMLFLTLHSLKGPAFRSMWCKIIFWGAYVEFYNVVALHCTHNLKNKL